MSVVDGLAVRGDSQPRARLLDRLNRLRRRVMAVVVRIVFLRKVSRIQSAAAATAAEYGGVSDGAGHGWQLVVVS